MNTKNDKISNIFNLVKSQQIACAAIALTLGLFSNAHAVPLFDVDFSGDTVGQAPSVVATPTAGKVATKPTSYFLGSGGTSGSILVAENYQAGSATLSGKSSVLSTDGKSIQLNFRGNAADFVADQDYTLSFDALVNGSIGNLTRNSLRVDLYNQTFSNLGYQAAIVLTGNGGIQLISGTNSTTFASQWLADEVLSLQLNVLYSVGKFQVILNGGAPLEINLNPQISAGVQSFQFSQGQSNAYFEAAISNIKAIPEPSAVMLLSLAAAALAFRRRIFRS